MTFAFHYTPCLARELRRLQGSRTVRSQRTNIEAANERQRAQREFINRAARLEGARLATHNVG